ncbi:5438_t:CDS:1, partial [Funneliformis mosseae]
KFQNSKILNMPSRTDPIHGAVSSRERRPRLRDSLEFWTEYIQMTLQQIRNTPRPSPRISRSSPPCPKTPMPSPNPTPPSTPSTPTSFSF